MLNVQTSLPITTYASRHNDTLRVLISNHVLDPILDGRETLLYGNFDINQSDLALAGYASFGQIDSTIAGLQTPIGNPNIQNAFLAANTTYTYSLSSYMNNTNVQLKILGSSGITEGKMFTIDSVNNNIIYEYDSLINTGLTRIQAGRSRRLLQKGVLNTPEYLLSREGGVLCKKGCRKRLGRERRRSGKH